MIAHTLSRPAFYVLPISDNGQSSLHAFLRCEPRLLTTTSPSHLFRLEFVERCFGSGTCIKI